MNSGATTSIVLLVVAVVLVSLATWFRIHLKQKAIRTRKHRHLEGNGEVVYMDMDEGFSDCQCGGGYVSMRDMEKEMEEKAKQSSA